jgi:hypothetical protein
MRYNTASIMLDQLLEISVAGLNYYISSDLLPREVLIPVIGIKVVLIVLKIL